MYIAEVVHEIINETRKRRYLPSDGYPFSVLGLNRFECVSVRGGTPVPSRTHYLKRRGIMPILGMIQAFQYMYGLSFMTVRGRQEGEYHMT